MRLCVQRLSRVALLRRTALAARRWRCRAAECRLLRLAASHSAAAACLRAVRSWRGRCRSAQLGVLVRVWHLAAQLAALRAWHAAAGSRARGAGVSRRDRLRADTARARDNVVLRRARELRLAQRVRALWVQWAAQSAHCGRLRWLTRAWRLATLLTAWQRLRRATAGTTAHEPTGGGRPERASPVH